MDKFEITGPGEYRTREGKKAVVNEIRDHGQWPARGLIVDGGDIVNADSAWRLNGEWEVERGVECRFDIVGLWEEPRVPTPVDDDAVDAEFVVEVPDSGAIGVDFEPVDYRPESAVDNLRAYTAAEIEEMRACAVSAASIAPPGPTIGEAMRRKPFADPEFREVDEPEPCDYRESAETLAAALRNLLASLPGAVSVKTSDAVTLARLALDGFAP